MRGEKGDLNPVSTLGRHPGDYNISLHRVPIFDPLKCLHQPHEHVRCLNQDLLLRRTDAWAAEKGDEFRRQLPVDPALRFELVDVLAPDVLIVVERPDVERYDGVLLHQYRGPAVRTATYGKYCVAQGAAEYAPSWALETDDLEKNLSEESERLNDVVGERLRADSKRGGAEIGLNIGVSGQLK